MKDLLLGEKNIHSKHCFTNFLMGLGRNASHSLPSLFQLVLTYLSIELSCQRDFMLMYCTWCGHQFSFPGRKQFVSIVHKSLCFSGGVIGSFQDFSWLERLTTVSVLFASLTPAIVHYWDCECFIGFSFYVHDEQCLMMKIGGAVRVTWTTPQMYARNKESSSICVPKACCSLFRLTCQ